MHELGKKHEAPEVDMQYLEQLTEATRQHPESKQARKAYADYIQQHVVRKMIEESPRDSFQEYFALALSQGADALKKGGYAVGAVIIRQVEVETPVRRKKQRKQVLVGGYNQVVADPILRPHAEEDVIRSVSLLRRYRNIGKGKVIDIRNTSASPEEEILVTSLEPCIKCFAKITVEKPDAVWIATPDVTAGAMLDGRNEMLPPFWAGRLEKRDIQVVEASDEPTSRYYINPLYRQIALDMFESTRQYIDDTINVERTENPRRFLRHARRSRRSNWNIPGRLLF